MVATSHFVVAISAPLVSASLLTTTFPGYPSCQPTTTTVYTTVTVSSGWKASTVNAAVASASTPVAAVAGASISTNTLSQQYSPPSDFTYPGVVFPTFSPENLNPNGPYYNPNNYIPEPITWPGRPTSGQTVVPDLPSGRPRPLGGDNAGAYNGPAWCLHGTDLKPALPQKDTNGDSQWGLIDCPRLPPYAGGHNSASSTSRSGSPTFRPTSSVTASGSRSSNSAGGSSGGPVRSSRISAESSRSAIGGSSSIIGNPTVSARSSSSSVGGSSSSSIGSGSNLSSSRNFNSSSSRASVTSSPQLSSTRSSSSSSASSGFPTLSPTCVNNTNIACGKLPDTGVVRHYDFSVAYGVKAPDGVTRNVILVNNQFPGPLIEANWGDWIEVTVTNNLPGDASDQGEPTAIHWHGFLQQETPFYDGVPSVMQGPIAPGKTVTYKFRADHYGTSWYHSHYSAQYAGGASGPIVIHGPATACYDEDIGPVMLSDWYHKDYFTLLAGQYNGTTALSTNALINGKMNFPCENTTAACTPNAGVSKFKFTSGKKYRLRLINTAADATMKYTIDGHNFTVFANDFIPVRPYNTSVITLGVGQRTDVVVEAVGKAGDAFWMRSEMGTFAGGNGCSFSSGVSTQAVAAIYYDGADTNSLPQTTSSLTDAEKKKCEGEDISRTQSLCPVPLDEDFNLMTFDVGAVNNGTHNVMHVNGSSFRANMNVNLLENVIEGNTTFEKEWNVYKLDSSKKAVRMIFRNNHVTHHPMHLHGHDVNVLAVGTGEWDGKITNPDNTLIRDVQMLKGNVGGVRTYIVLQFNLDNPGVWPMHCHIAWHVSAGLYINLLESPEKIDYDLPADIKQTTVDYAAWQARGNVVNQIDSGL
ncbi:hypothetical protein EJ08DRAFT_660978 [Tothia fuscella]|uniref:Laccase n=1 Tax=Tothia fuscella TaxID=1048955 RepID=A0A9P4NR91_9PEZI|nr:hypothetical protein EJ08DRAFT_660978 [Tothia fuscella]